MKTIGQVRVPLLLGTLLVISVTGSGLTPQVKPAKRGRTMWTLETKSFSSGGEIPRRYTCVGEDLSPELTWSEPPPGTQTLALIADDPDAPGGTWTHWVAWNMSPLTRSLAEGAGKGNTLPSGGAQGRNDFGRSGYGGPCPPPGKTHRYFFKLYALDTKLNLKPGATKHELESAMKGHILAQSDVMGTFKR